MSDIMCSRAIGKGVGKETHNFVFFVSIEFVLAIVILEISYVQT